MIEIIHERCDRCGTCIAVCSASALALTSRLEVIAESCVSCGLCVRVCPAGALRMTTSTPESTGGGENRHRAAIRGQADGREYWSDVLVIGGGPAGAMAAYHAAAQGITVRIVDRNEKVGIPVRCGEAVGSEALQRFTEVDPGWIASTIRGVVMVSPSGTQVRVDRMSQGWVVRRDIMDAQLVERAVKRGAKFHGGVSIVSVGHEGNEYQCRADTGERFTARCVVVADGVESRIARFLGWRTALRPEDISSCAFGRVRHPTVPVDRIEMHYGSLIAPRGYAWVFPRGDGSANVGVGVLGTCGEPGRAMECLQRFVSRRFGEVKVTDIHCGGVPVGLWVRPLVRDGALLVGDAARQVDALTGGGIAHAMQAGALAGAAVAQAFLQRGTFTPELLRQYERAWMKGPGRILQRTYALKRMVVELSDAELDSIARRLTAGTRTSLGLASICIAAFARRPLLLLRALMVYH